MFLHLSVSHSVHRGGVHSGGGYVWPGGMHGGGMCMTGGMCGRRGGRAWQERRPLQQAVRILLECILQDRVYAVILTLAFWD